MNNMKNILPSILGVLLILLLTSCNEKFIIYSSNRYKPIPVVDASLYESPQKRPNQDNQLALGLSISGGGSRAQYFGTGVLIGLDDIREGTNSFLNEIDYYSTVSGGCFAAGYYLTLRKNDILSKYQNYYEYWKSDVRKDELQEFMYMGAKAAHVFKLPKYEKNKIRKAYPNMINYELLQAGKEYNNTTIGEQYLIDYFKPVGQSVTLPMFVPNGTIYNNGERFPFMPHIVSSLHINGSLLPERSFKSSNGYDMPLAYAIAGSAAFPGVLPMLKLKLAGNDSVIRVIDGGAVDNFGFKTLFELLHTDKSANSNRKRALIVDCGGFGNEIQYQKNNRVRIKKLLKKSLLFTVDIPLLYSDESISCIGKSRGIDVANNVHRIGFSTIKEKIIALENSVDKVAKDDVEYLKRKIMKKKMDWEDVYRDLANSPIFDNSGLDVNSLSELPINKFDSLSYRQIFEIFELSSQIDTKIKIYPWEKEVLVLAGRYAVYLKRYEISAMLK
jgi:hypothetical protein